MGEPSRKSEIAERLFHRLYPTLHTKSSVGDIMATAALLADTLIALDNGGSPFGQVTQSSAIPRVYVEDIQLKLKALDLSWCDEVDGLDDLKESVNRALGLST